MNISSSLLSRIGAVSAAAALAAGGASALAADHPMAASSASSTRAAALHDGMRKLWEDHITWTRLAIVAFAAGDPDLKATETRLLRNQTDIGNAIAKAKAAWYANGNQIADFLNKANPRNWPRKTMRSMMKEHLDVTLKEAVDELTGKYDASVRDYESIHRHILVMADGLSTGIIRQFPSRFRR